MGKHKDKKRKNSSGIYSTTPKSAKHGGSPQALDSVSDTLKQANDVLYSSPMTQMNNLVFEPLDMHESVDLNDITHGNETTIPKCTGDAPSERSRSANNVHEIKTNSSTCSPTDSDIVEYLKRLDQKMIGLDNRLSKLDAVEREVFNLCSELNKLWTFVHETTIANSSKIDENRSKMESLEFTLGSVSDQLTQIQKEKQFMQKDLLYMQSQNMRNNLIFAKIPETDNEDPAKTEAIVRDFMVEKLQIAK